MVNKKFYCLQQNEKNVNISHNVTVERDFGQNCSIP